MYYFSNRNIRITEIRFNAIECKNKVQTLFGLLSGEK